jgi:hypothetical protein
MALSFITKNIEFKAENVACLVEHVRGAVQTKDFVALKG